MATSIAKLIPKRIPQNLVISSHIVLLVIIYIVSIIPSNMDKPKVRGTKIKWYKAVKANCNRAGSAGNANVTISTCSAENRVNYYTFAPIVS